VNYAVHLQVAGIDFHLQPHPAASGFGQRKSHLPGRAVLLQAAAQLFRGDSDGFSGCFPFR
jgi:hypothetical protein